MRKTLILISMFSFCTYARTSTLVVNKTIEISNTEMVSDKDKFPYKCPHKSRFQNFMKLKMGKNNLNLQCHNDYLGGVVIEGQDSLRLAGISGDAGDTWSEITKLELIDNKLYAYRMMFSKKNPSVDCEYVPKNSHQQVKDFCKTAKITCGTFYEIYEWEKNKFIPKQKSLKKAPTSFTLDFPNKLKSNCGKPWKD